VALGGRLCLNGDRFWLQSLCQEEANSVLIGGNIIRCFDLSNSLRRGRQWGCKQQWTSIHCLHDNSHGHVGIDDAFCDGHADRAVIAGGLDSEGCSAAMTYRNCVHEPNGSPTQRHTRAQQESYEGLSANANDGTTHLFGYWGGLAQGLMSRNEISFHDLLEGV